MDRTFHEQPCNPSDTVASPKPCNSQNLEGKKPAWCLPLGSASACGLRQGAVNAGGSQAGISGWGTFGGSILYFFQPAIFTSDARTLRVLQRQLQFSGERINR